MWSFTLYLIFLNTITSIAWKFDIFNDEYRGYHVLCTFPNDINNSLLLINAKHLYKPQHTGRRILITHLPANNRYSIALYSINMASIKLERVNHIDIDSNDEYRTFSQSKMHLTIIHFQNDRIDTLTATLVSSYYATVNVITA